MGKLRFTNKIFERSCFYEKVKILEKKLIFNREAYNSILESYDSRCIIYMNPINYEIIMSPNILNNPNVYIHIDNIYMTKILKLVSGIQVKRLSFDMNLLAKDFFEYCLKNNKSIFFCGGTKEDINIFVKKIKENYPSLAIKGFIDGYQSNEKIMDTLLKIDFADFIIVGLGNIRQELFAIELYNFLDRLGKKAIIMTVGAFISQTATSNSLYFYPEWVYKYNLRWLYRLLKDKKIIRRLIIHYPRILYRIFKEILCRR